MPAAATAAAASASFVVVTSKLVQFKVTNQQQSVEYGVVILRPCSSCYDVLQTILTQLNLPIQIKDSDISVASRTLKVYYLHLSLRLLLIVSCRNPPLGGCTIVGEQVIEHL